MNADDQIEFPSLAFPADRKNLRVEEIALRLDCTTQHVLDLIEEGKMRAINIAGANATERRFLRVPVEAWNKYLKDNTV